ncbi:MAG: putative zinc-binding protein [Cyclobacteriaceae bacterium]|nr:putative zinc-binding protein [Cyclobacteriaceae bacterium]
MNYKPIVYSCSGCSSAAQMANYLAIQLDRSGYAEMSCIVGVGGNVKKLVHTAKSGRKLIAIDGCPLACSRACLQNHNLSPDLYIQLTEYGVRKKQGVDYDPLEADQILEQLQTQLTESSLINEQSKNTFTFQNN